MGGVYILKNILAVWRYELYDILPSERDGLYDILNGGCVLLHDHLYASACMYYLMCLSKGVDVLSDIIYAERDVHRVCLLCLIFFMTGLSDVTAPSRIYFS